MNDELRQRADRIIDRYNAKKAEYRSRRPASTEAAAHDLYLAEVPRLGDRIARAIGEFNDRADQTGLRVAVRSDDAPHFALAIFKVNVIGVFDPAFELCLTVDHDGNVIGFISGKGKTDRLIKHPVLEVSCSQIFGMIVDLVEIEIEYQPV